MTVAQVQHLLSYLGFDPGNVDNLWGPATSRALAEFQERFGGIVATGTITVETEKALRHAVAYDMFKNSDATDDPEDVFWEGIQYFKKREFACKCGQYHAAYCDGYPHKIQPLLVQIAERARAHFGVPIEIVSGLRCPQHNADQPGSAKNSQHMYGEAADVRAVGVDQQTLLNWFLSQTDVRYAYPIEGSQNVHFDIQPVGR
jgi:uncharacterized protein YcbK (DUF882 family)